MSGKSPSTLDWQRLWVATRQQDWTSLAVIPGDAGIDIVKVAESLVTAGRLYGGRPVTLLNAAGTRLNDVRQLVDQLGTMTGRGEWVIVAVDPIGDNPTGVPLVRAASAALMVLRLGESLIGPSRAAIETVGRARFVGSLVLGLRSTSPATLVPPPPLRPGGDRSDA